MKKKFELRPISAWEAIRASQEAAGHEESALWRNACVLARALYRGRRRVFSSGEEVLKSMPAETVACWMKAYTRICMARVASWEQEKEVLKKDAWGRLRWKVLRSLGGPAWKDMTEADIGYCVLQMILDGEERLEKLCPSCRRELGQDACPVCGAVQFGENPNFDEKRFEELMAHGSSDMADAAAGE